MPDRSVWRFLGGWYNCRESHGSGADQDPLHYDTGLMMTFREHRRMSSSRPLHRRFWLTVWSCAWLCLAQAVSGQDTLVVSSAAACPGCSIEFEKVVTLGSVEDSASLSPPIVHVTRTETGRYFAINRMGGARDRLFVFGPEGTLTGTIGRSGDGPGEFGMIAYHLVDESDSLFVFDMLARRLTVFSPTDAVVRTERMPLRNESVHGAVRFGPREWVLAHVIPTSERSGYPLHLIESGRIVRSFGSENPRVLPDWPSLNVRYVTAGAGHTVWSVQPDRYEVELWDLDGSLQGVLRRDALWFPPREQRGRAMGQEPPDPRVQAVRALANGHLALLVSVSDSEWRPRSWEAGEFGPQGTGYEQNEYDTVLEIIDPSSGRLISSGRHPEFMFEFLSDDLVVSRRVDDLGLLYMDVWRMNRPVGGNR